MCCTGTENVTPKLEGNKPKQNCETKNRIEGCAMPATAEPETGYLNLEYALHEYERCQQHLIHGEHYWMQENRRGIGRIDVRIERDRSRAKPWDLWAVAPGWRVTVESDANVNSSD